MRQRASGTRRWRHGALGALRLDRACARTARLGQISEGTYTIIDHPWSYYDGTRSRMGLKECAAAVRALAGAGCDGIRASSELRGA